MQPPEILVHFQKTLVSVSEHLYDLLGLESDSTNCVPHKEKLVSEIYYTINWTIERH
jgi:hypothetical protein